VCVGLYLTCGYSLGHPKSPPTTGRTESGLHVEKCACMFIYYSSFSLVLLIYFEPRCKGFMPRANRLFDRQKEVHSKIKLLCSIAQCRPETPGPSLVACMAVWLAGDMVEDSHERKRMLELLATTEAVHGWPTQDICTELVGLWEG
jgi:hypothetical protein